MKGAVGDLPHPKEDCLQALRGRGNQRVTSDSPEDTYEALEKYGTDLVRRGGAKNGPSHPGRDEIEM